jgi:DNA-binding CsgD family transcriptional regulator
MVAVLTDLTRQHTGEVAFLVRAPATEDAAPAVVVRAAVEAGRRLTARSVHAVDSLDGGGGRLAGELERRGVAVRVAARVPMKLVLFRGRAALLKADPERPEQDDLVVVRSPALLASLQVIVELLWERATPLGRVPDDGRVPDARLLELMAAGCQDEAIAEELGVSVRTVRRRVAELLEGFGARTRFQAGAQAARRGLL